MERLHGQIMPFPAYRKGYALSLSVKSRGIQKVYNACNQFDGVDIHIYISLYILVNEYKYIYMNVNMYI